MKDGTYENNWVSKYKNTIKVKFLVCGIKFFDTGSSLYYHTYFYQTDAVSYTHLDVYKRQEQI